MTAVIGPGTLTRRELLAEARQSRRPSRLGRQAGTTAEPDRRFASDAGFPALLDGVWHKVMNVAQLSEALDILLTLDGHVTGDVQLRALRLADECAIEVLFGRGWRETAQVPAEPALAPDCRSAPYVGALGLTKNGRIVVSVPERRAPDPEDDLVGAVLPVPWSASAIATFRSRYAIARRRATAAAVDARRWLRAQTKRELSALLDDIDEAALRTAPFVLHQDGLLYTNFRDTNNLAGKTLGRNHPDCVTTALRSTAPEAWEQHHVLAVVCLTVLIRSGGYARVEEANGTQLTLDHVGHLLERIRRAYHRTGVGEFVEPAQTRRVVDLMRLADRLHRQRTGVATSVQLYREIQGPLVHKVERVAGPLGQVAQERLEQVCSELSAQLPVAGSSIAELRTELTQHPSWLTESIGEFGSGLEHLIFHAVTAARKAFGADFAMSRGMRSLPALIEALRTQSWGRIVDWELPAYFCCVVADPRARRHFDSLEQLADISWSMSARMQYNSWHFLPGNLPKSPAVRNRDYFVPPTIPDIAYFSDQHHRGHIAGHVRFSIRSPQAVEILGQRFAGFIDLRLLRCAGSPFGEQDLLAAHQTSGLIALATTLAADRVQQGAAMQVTAFDSAWHLDAVRRSDAQAAQDA